MSCDIAHQYFSSTISASFVFLFFFRVLRHATCYLCCLGGIAPSKTKTSARIRKTLTGVTCNRL